MDLQPNNQPTVEISEAWGRSMLNWEGKHQPAAVPVVAARMVEIYDPRRELPLAQINLNLTEPRTPTSFLRYAVPNCLYQGDNQSVLAHLLANGWRGKVKLIYIDPPFGGSGDYVRKVRLRDGRGRVVGSDVQYSDTWDGDGYLQFIYERLFLLRELLAEDGSIWLHCDYRQVHRLRMLLEEVFGEENYLNTIAWRSQVARGAKVSAFYFPFSTQYIEVFAKNRRTPTVWHPQKKRLIFSRRRAAARFMEDDGGFFRTSDPGTYSFERLKGLHAEGRLYAPYGGDVVVDEENRRVYASNGGNIGVKYYLIRLGEDRYAALRGVDNMWDDIPGLGTTPSEDVGYPTQKTEALLRRILAAATDPDDLVLDCFLGSGTTAAVAQKMGRRWIGCDLTDGAIQATRRRLQHIIEESGPGFAVYRMENHNRHAAATLLPAQAEVVIQRADEEGTHIIVEVVDYQAPVTPSPAFQLAKGESIEHTAGWSTWVEAIDIDPAYDGSVFRSTLFDLPQKRTDQIEGIYVMAAPSLDPTTVAVRITDIFGNESLITKQV